MQVIPSIDVAEGRSRLVFWPGPARGTGTPTDRPERIARYFVELGAPAIHLVDLDGARAGRPAATRRRPAGRGRGRGAIAGRRRCRRRRPDPTVVCGGGHAGRDAAACRCGGSRSPPRVPRRRRQLARGWARPASRAAARVSVARRRDAHRDAARRPPRSCGGRALRAFACRRRTRPRSASLAHGRRGGRVPRGRRCDVVGGHPAAGRYWPHGGDPWRDAAVRPRRLSGRG